MQHCIHQIKFLSFSKSVFLKWEKRTDCIRAPPRRGRYWEIHPRRPRDFLRAKLEGNLEGRGKSRGRRGWISQFLPSFGGVRTFSSSSILSLGMDQEIHPSRQGRIDSVKINPSLPMMREWVVHPLRPQDFPRPLRSEGMYNPIPPLSRQFTDSIPPKFWWSTDILSSSILPQGRDQEILLYYRERFPVL